GGEGDMFVRKALPKTVLWSALGIAHLRKTEVEMLRGAFEHAATDVERAVKAFQSALELEPGSVGLKEVLDKCAIKKVEVIAARQTGQTPPRHQSVTYELTSQVSPDVL